MKRFTNDSILVYFRIFLYFPSRNWYLPAPVSLWRITFTAAFMHTRFNVPAFARTGNKEAGTANIGAGLPGNIVKYVPFGHFQIFVFILLAPRELILPNFSTTSWPLSPLRNTMSPGLTYLFQYFLKISAFSLMQNASGTGW